MTLRYIGIDIGGTKCAVVLGDEKGNIIQKEKFSTVSVNETLEKIFYYTEKMGSCRGIGISCGGPLDPIKGVINSPPNLPGWDDIPIVDMLKERFGVPAYLCNDANACALAEWRFGAGRGTENMIFLTFGTGLGAGLILNGRLYSGSCGMAGEVGHIRLEKDGPTGYGKNGSLEGFCSGGGIAQIGKKMAREAIERGEVVSFASQSEIDGITAKSIGEAAERGDPLAIEIFNLSAEKLGLGLSVLIDILNPECIVIGSIFTRSETLFRSVMEKKIENEALLPSRRVCRIVPSALGESIGDIAALTIAIDHDRLSNG